MFTNALKKGTKIKSVQLGTPVTGIIMDNMRGNTRLVDVKGSEVGLFDEIGSVYSHEIVLAEVDGAWVEVEHTEAQKRLKQTVEELFGAPIVG